MKGQYISKRGRATLIKSTLSSLPIYLSLFQLLGTERLRFDKIKRNFLCGGRKMEKNPHLVNWNMVCLDMKSRG